MKQHSCTVELMYKDRAFVFDCDRGIYDGLTSEEYAKHMGNWWKKGCGACDCVKSLFIKLHHDHDFALRPCGKDIRLTSLVTTSLGHLEPCPFCGCEGILLTHDQAFRENYAVRCSSNSCILKNGGVVRRTAEDARDAWNTRIEKSEINKYD